MKQACNFPLRLLQRLALTAALLSGLVPCLAHADDYSDVNQLVKAGKLAEALKKADQYLATKPRDPQMRFIKGVIQRDAGNQSDAITTFTKLTEDYPELPEPYNNLAVLYAGQSQFDKARAALEMAIRTNPSYSTAHENLGDVYAKLASQAYNKALQLDGSNTAVQPKLALIRELFNPNLKGQKPVAPASSVAPAPLVVPSPPSVASPAPPAPSPSVQPAISAASPSLPTTAAAKPASTQPAPKQASAEDGSKEVETAVRVWAKAWSTKDVKTYLGAYGRDFDPPGTLNRSAWEEERKLRISSKNSISVKLENLSVSVNGSSAKATFRQDYKADALAVSSRKRLDFVKSGDRWLIVKESTGS